MLTPLCDEKGGVDFAVHPNRNVKRRVNRGEIEAFAADMKYFFDPIAMSRYRTVYLSQKVYVTMVMPSPLRQSLVTAAQMQPVTGISRPRTRFIKRENAMLAKAK